MNQKLKIETMGKYKITFETTLYIDVTVEAENQEDAINEASNQVYVSGYCGNGGCDKLVGVSDSNMSVYANEYFEEHSSVEEIK